MVDPILDTSQATGGKPDESNQAQTQTGGEGEANQTSKKSGGKTVKLGDFDIPEDVLQSHIDSVIKNRINEVKDKEREKYKDYSDLKAAAHKLKELEDAKLSEDAKAAKKLQELKDEIAAKEKIVADSILHDLKRSKIEQAIADEKMSLPKGKTIESLVKRCLVTREEDIDADVEELIGFFPKVEPPKNGAQGSGRQPADGKGTKTYTRAQIKDRDFYEANREDIQKAMQEGRIK
jgi:hypothetical protein